VTSSSENGIDSKTPHTMSVGGVPALQLEGLGGRNTPRSSTASRQQTLQRVFKGLDDDEDARRPSVAASTVPPAMNSSRRSSASFRRLDDDEDSPRPSIAAKNSAPATSSISSTTPRASRDEIERRRKVMFDSEEEDTPRGPQATRNKVHTLYLYCESDSMGLCHWKNFGETMVQLWRVYRKNLHARISWVILKSTP
jgi:hypothetical protein